MNHTQGPWTIRADTFKSAREVLDDVERMLANGGLHNFTITTVGAPDTLRTPPPADSDGTVCVAYLGNGPTAEANAALIAAAPDLRRAIEDGLRVARAALEMSGIGAGEWPIRAAIEKMDAAIKKADGK